MKRWWNMRLRWLWLAVAPKLVCCITVIEGANILHVLIK